MSKAKDTRNVRRGPPLWLLLASLTTSLAAVQLAIGFGQFQPQLLPPDKHPMLTSPDQQPALEQISGKRREIREIEKEIQRWQDLSARH